MKKFEDRRPLSHRQSGLLRSRLASLLHPARGRPLNLRNLFQKPRSRKSVRPKNPLLKSRLRKQSVAQLLVAELEAHVAVDNMLWEMIHELRNELEALRGKGA